MGSQQPTPPVPTNPKIKYPEPKRFHGHREDYPLWRTQCDVYFSANRHLFANEENKTYFMLALMDGGEAAVWVRSFIDRNSPADQFSPPAHKDFLKRLDESFAPPDVRAHALHELSGLLQAGDPIASFNPMFKIAAHKAGITDDRILIDYYEKAIDMPIRIEIRMRVPQPTEFAEWTTLAHQIDDLHRRNMVDFGGHLNPYRNHSYSSSKPKYRSQPTWPNFPAFSSFTAPPAAPPRDPNAMDVDNVYHQQDQVPASEEETDSQSSVEDEDEDDEYVIQAADLNMVMTPKQREWFRNGKCLRCGGNHYARNCPRKQRKSKMPFKKKGNQVNPYRANSQSYRPQSPPKIATATRAVNSISKATVAANILNTLPESDRTEALKAFSDF